MIERIVDLVADANNRLLTIVGPGGVGKTALVDALAERLLPTPVAIKLRALDRPDDVVGALAAEIGIPDGAPDGLRASLAAALTGRVVVLDNLEQIAGVGDLLTELLAVSPALQLICTSQVATGAVAEHVVALAPLDMSDAAELLTQEASRRGTALTAEHATMICEATGGLPLAVELAAARLGVLTPRELATRLGRDASDLGVALSRSTEWSYELLSPPAATVLRRMAVFVGEREAADIEALVANDVFGNAVEDVIDALGELVDASLVRRSERDEASWFSMLPPIHAFARGRLARDGELDAAHCARAAWALEQAADARVAVTSERHEAGLLAFDQLRTEFRDVARWSVENEAGAATAAALVGLQRPYWFYRGMVSDADSLSSALLASPAKLSPLDRSRVSSVAGDCATARGNMREALRFAQQAAAAAEEVCDNLPLLGETYSGVGRAARNVGDFDAAVVAGRRGVEIADTIGAPRLRVLARSNLAAFLAWTDALDEALELINGVLLDSDAVLTPMDRAVSLGTYVEVLLRRGDLGEAVEAASSWSATCQQVGNTIGVLEALLARSDALARLSRFTEALADADAARALAADTEHAFGATASGLRRATALAGLGERDRALQAFADALAHADQFDAGVDVRGVVASIGACGAGLLTDAVALTLIGGDLAADTAALERRLGVARVTELRKQSAEMSEVALVDLALRSVRTYLAGAVGASSLTARERDILRLVARGLTDKEIATELEVAVRTVTTHVSRVLAKLGVATRTAAAAKALQLDLV